MIRRDLWHGGAPGRKQGERLLPPAVTGLQRTSTSLSIAAGLDSIAHRRDRVYLTVDRELARVWAGQWISVEGRVGHGWLYRVSAEVELLEPDADLLSLPGLSFQAPEAVVDRVYERAVSPGQAAFRRTLERVIRDLERAKLRRGQGRDLKKTTAYAVPALLAAPGAALATSNKRDLYDTTGTRPHPTRPAIQAGLDRAGEAAA